MSAESDNIGNNDNKTRYYMKTVTRTCADGSVRVCRWRQKYTVVDRYPEPSDAVKNEMMMMAKMGVPATRIAKSVGISVYRVRKLLGRTAATTIVESV